MKSPEKQIIRSALGVFLYFAAISANAQSVIVVDPWIMAAPPNAPTLALFMKIENHTDTDIAIVNVETTFPVEHVDIHRTKMADGMMHMMTQESIPVAAHSETILKHGSWHIMLRNPEKVPDIGDKVEFTLVLDDGSEQNVIAIVKKGMMME